MKTESVKKALKDIHHEQHTKRDTGKDTKANVGRNKVNVQRRKHGLLPKYSGKLRVGKRKSPETKVRGSVGNHTKNKLNRFNRLVNDNLAKSVLFSMVVIAAVMLLVVIVVLNGNMRLPREKVRLGKEKNGNRRKGDNEKNVLNISLSVVEGLFDIARLQSNIDEGRNEVGRLATVAAAAIVERALGSSVIISGTRVTPRSAGAVCNVERQQKVLEGRDQSRMHSTHSSERTTASVTLNPFAVIVR